ncbi:MAG TPA: hypothetical protein VLK25_01010 [Allosphingosinicella sp.]|nr:hypothetical protein [Allosphingosinicella sp.]
MAAAALLMLGACQSEAPVANRAEPPKAPAPEGDVAAAERLVRARIGTTDEIRFSGATRSASEGVPIVCGRYEQGGVSRRYIVVDRDRAFIEPQMRAGEMDRAVAEFCREGADNAPRGAARGERG